MSSALISPQITGCFSFLQCDFSLIKINQTLRPKWSTGMMGLWGDGKILWSSI